MEFKTHGGCLCRQRNLKSNLTMGRVLSLSRICLRQIVKIGRRNKEVESLARCRARICRSRNICRIYFQCRPHRRRRLAIFWENAYKKGAGRMRSTLSRQVRRASVPLLLRGCVTFFQPPSGASRTGAFVLTYSRDEARSIRQRSVSSAKSTRRLMRPTSLTRQAGVCAVPNAWEESHVTGDILAF